MQVIYMCLNGNSIEEIFLSLLQDRHPKFVMKIHYFTGINLLVIMQYVLPLFSSEATL